MLTRHMKDSGVEWIGKIPEDWEVSQISRYFNPRNEKVSDIDYKPLSVTKNGIVPQLDNAAKSSNHNDRKLVKKEDFVINSRSDRKMSSGIAKEDGSVSLINIVLFSRNILPIYTNYLLKNYSFAEEFYRWGSGIVADLWSTNWEKMKKINIPIPPVKEQEQIAVVLDLKIDKINSIISDTQQSIIELKKYKQSLITETVTKGLDKTVEMKDSGIEWIGEVPENWRVIKLKYCVGIRETKKVYSAGVKYIGLENIEKESGRLLSLSENFTGELEKEFKVNDILYSKLRPYLSKAYSPSFEGVCSNEFIVFSEYKGHNEYLKYWLLNTKFTDTVNSSTYGTKMPRANLTYIENTHIAFPPVQQQQQIVDFLDNKTSKIDSLIADKEKMITEYEAYKKSLIYEYVTGKKQV